MLGNNLYWGGFLPSQEWLQTISQAASSQHSLDDSKRDITLYITTLGSHKHNKSGAKSINAGNKWNKEGRNKEKRETTGLTEGQWGGQETRFVKRESTLRENWYMGWILLRSFIMKYNKEALAAAGR